MQEQLRPVVVDLEPVVLVAAEHEQGGRVAVGHVLGVGHRDPFGVFERAVARVGDQGDGADDDLVVAGAEVDDRADHRVVRQDAVGAAVGVDLDLRDVAVADHVAREARRIADGDRAGAGRADALGVERDLVSRVGRAEDQEVGPGRAAGVADLHPGAAAAGEVDHVIFGRHVGRVGRVRHAAEVVERDRAGPGGDLDVRIADDDRVIRRADDHDVVARPAVQHGLLEQAVEVLNDRVAREPAGVVREGQVGVGLVGENVAEVAVAQERAVGERAAVIAQDSADDELILVEADVGVVGFLQGVVAAGIEERVEPPAAGDGVVPQAAVEQVGERRADELVVPGAGDQAQGDRVGHGDDLRRRVVGHLGGAQAAGVDQVVAGLGVDGQAIVLADPLGLGDIDDVERGGQRAVGVDPLAGHADGGELVRGLVGVLRRQGEGIVDRVVAVDGDRVGRAVVGGDDVRDDDIVSLAIDGFRDPPGALDGLVLAGIDGDFLDAGAFEVLHGDGVGPGAAVHFEPLDAVAGDDAVIGADEDLAGGPLEDLDQVVLGRAADEQGVGLAVVGVGVDRASEGRQHQVDQVVAGAGVDRVDPAAAGNDVVARAGIDRVVARAAGNQIVAGAAEDGRRAGAVLGDDVVAGAAVEVHRLRAGGHQEVVAAVAVEVRRVRAAIDEGVVPLAAVDDDGDLDVVLDDDRVGAAAEVGDDPGDARLGAVLAGEVAAAAEGGDADLGVLGVAADLLDDVRLVRLVLGQLAVLRPVADVQVEIAAAEVLLIVLVARQEDRLGQLQVADREVRGLRDLDE